MNATRPAAEPLVRTDLPLPGRREGKVRDVYERPARGDRPAQVVIVATDRLSAFDVVLPTPIPGKGRLLHAISSRWFELIEARLDLPHHVLTDDVRVLDELTDGQRALIEGRTTIARAARVVPIECVVRGSLAGSGWADYRRTGAVCGIELPPGLERCGRLPEPIFTPATKAERGEHDQNVPMETAMTIAGGEVMATLERRTLDVYRLLAEHAEARGLILADTKLEFGLALDERGEPTSELILIDEVGTPDSSRYWPADAYAPGREQDSFDKQFVRNHLLELVEAGRWDKSAPGPELPEAIVRSTLERYEQALAILFGDDDAGG